MAFESYTFCRTLTDTLAIYGARSRGITNTGKNCWPGVVLEVFVPSHRVPVNPALQTHLNCETSSCVAIQVPPFKQVESSQGSSAKSNIHAGVTFLRLNDCFILMRTPVTLKLPDKFSNSLIIHAALTQPEHLILVRWMGLETQ